MNMPTFMIQKGVLGRWRWFTIVIGLIAMVLASGCRCICVASNVKVKKWHFNPRKS